MEARIRHPRNDTEDQTRFLHISWLYAQDYCEYQLYLEQVKGVTVEATQAMVEGSDEHQRLEDEFLAKAELEYTFEEAVEESRRTPISSRELYVEDRSLNIRGFDTKNQKKASKLDPAHDTASFSGSIVSRSDVSST